MHRRLPRLLTSTADMIHRFGLCVHSGGAGGIHGSVQATASAVRLSRGEVSGWGMDMSGAISVERDVCEHEGGNPILGLSPGLLSDVPTPLPAPTILA